MSAGFSGSHLSYIPAPDNPFMSPAAEAPNPFLSPPAPAPAPNPFLSTPANGGTDFKSSRPAPPPPPGAAFPTPSTPAPRPAGFGAGLPNAPSKGGQGKDEADLAPRLGLPVLETNLDEETLRELSYYIFMACLSQVAPGAGKEKGGGGTTHHQQQQRQSLAATIREQLKIPEAKAKTMLSVMPLLVTTSGNEWNAPRMCSMEGLATLLRLARPQHVDAQLNGGGGTASASASASQVSTPMRSSNSHASKVFESLLQAGSKAGSGGGLGSVKSGDSSYAPFGSNGSGDPDEKSGPQFDTFNLFVHWRKTVGRVLHASAHTAVAPWERIRQQQQQDGSKPSQQTQASRKVLARLCGALRRIDVAREDEMDEEEYAEAAAAAMGASSALALLALPPSPTPSPDQPPGPSHVGWALPWSIRARVAETLLFAMFASLESSSYIDEAVSMSAYLDNVVWPALGVSESLSLALNAWVHLRQYIVTSDITLSRQIKHMLSKLTTSPSSTTLPGTGINPDDLVTAEVRSVSIMKMRKRLSDYHVKFPKGKEVEMQAMIDVLAFAQRLSSEEEDNLGCIVTELARESACAQFGRMMAPRVNTAPTTEQALLDAINIARSISQAEKQVYAPILASHYPQQAANPVMAGMVAEIGTRQHIAETSAALHALLGNSLLVPWMKGELKLDPMVASVFSSALKFDRDVAKSVAAATDDTTTVQAMIKHRDKETLAKFCRWPLTEPLKVVTVDWASMQVDRLNTWGDRQLQQENWVAVNEQDGCAQSAVEIVKLVQDMLDALYDLGLPLRFEGRLGALDVVMNGIDTVMEMFSNAVITKLGSPSRVVPPTPQVTRYKKEFVTKQEQAEAALVSNATGPVLPKKGKRMHIPGTKGWSSSGNPNSITFLDLLSTMNFKAGKNPQGIYLESVPRVGTSPDYTTIHKALTNPVLICCIMSAQFLLNQLDGLAKTAYRHLTDEGAIIAAPKPTGEAKPVYLEPARNALTHALNHSCNFLCCKIVYWDMRSAWCEHLYRHHASGNGPFSTNIEPLLDALNQVLADIGDQMPDSTRAYFAAELLKVTCEAYNRVLLDGGPCRWFSPSDVPILEADLRQLALLFEAEGEGLPRSQIKDIMAGTYRILGLIKMDLSDLMELLKTTRKENAAAAAASGSGLSHSMSNNKVMRKLRPGGTEVPISASAASADDGGPPYTEGELMRALARRPERTGSKLLKEKYGIPTKFK